MNGNFWGHLVRAAGYAIAGGEEADQDAQPRARTARRTGTGTGTGASFGSTKGKKCCSAKREGSSNSGAKAASAPVATAPGTSFGTVSPVRRRGGNGSASR